MDFGLGSVGENVGKLENYSGALYQVDRKDYNYFWQLFGQPSSAPPLKGNTSDPCNDGEEIEYWVEARDNQPPQGKWGKSSSYYYLWKKMEKKQDEKVLLTLEEILKKEESIYKDTFTAKNSMKGKLTYDVRQNNLS